MPHCSENSSHQKRYTKEGENRENIGVIAITCLTCAFASLQLLLFAFVVWFAEILGSIPLALTICGAALGLAGGGIYLIWLRPALSSLQDQLHTISEVAHLISKSYNWIISKIAQILSTTS